jgi:hypothetical protein
MVGDCRNHDSTGQKYFACACPFLANVGNLDDNWELPYVSHTESAMRKLILAITALILVPTALAALTAGGGLVGSTDPGATQKSQTHSGGVAGGGQGGFLRGHDILAKGDMSGTGGGMMGGGMMGDMMGGMGGGGR